MKVEINKNQTIESTFVEIHCREVTEEVSKLERYVKRYKSFLPATADGETVNVALDDVLYVESVDKRTYVYTENKVLMTDKRLYEFEDLLDKRDFFRCSKSTILNLEKVTKIKPEITRNILATLCNGETIIVSRRYATELKKLIGIER
ncbi:MAG: LytTR family transcriptional regulator DNA-binding domain-containing protein [Acetatifactor sp.]|nr:LytTR family transcriptional regulator DNA-binding domain-containing protein [Acetatifactor sp.]